MTHAKEPAPARPGRTARPRRMQRGLTLIELIIVVLIAGILARFAYQSYSNNVQQAHRGDAKTALLDLAAREERFFTVNNSYTGVATALGYSSAFPVALPGGAAATTSKLRVSAAGAGSFTVVAVPTGTQAADTCGTYQLDNLGNQTSTGSLTGAISCW